MKKLILTSAVLILITAGLFSFTKDDIPAAVKAKFATEYPSVKKVKWDNEEGKFEAHFTLNEVETSVLYDASGNKLETEIEINVSELPKGVADYLAKNYAGEKVKEAAKITNGKGVVTFEAEVKAGDLIFDAKGKFVELKSNKKEKDEDDDDEDKD